MARAFNPKKIHDFVPEEERSLPPSEQTVFKLRRLTVAEHAMVMDEFAVGQINIDKYKEKDPNFAAMLMAAAAGLPGKKMQALVHAADMALVGWANVKDEDGAVVPFPQFSAVDYLQPNVVMEIGNEVIRLNTLGKDDLGKSKPPSA